MYATDSPDSNFSKEVITEVQIQACESKVPAGAIAGGTVGGVVGLGLVAILAVLLLRRRKDTKAVGLVHGDTESVDTVMHQKTQL
jgi:hypothetical protein